MINSKKAKLKRRFCNVKNIRFYAAEKYNSDDYEKVEDMIYKTTDKKTYGESLSLKGCSDTELVSKLLKSEDWVEGSSNLLKKYLILTYDGKDTTAK